MTRKSTKKQKGKKKGGRRALRRPRTFDKNVTQADALDALLRDRYHGASNIRGIRFQLRYSVLRAVELGLAARDSADPGGALHFEGLEDLDLEGSPTLRKLEVATSKGSEFIQVKTDADAWSWHQLKEPLVGFLEILRTRTEDPRFRLVLNCPMRGDLGLLARFRDLGPGERAALQKKFRTLCRGVGGSTEEANRLLGLMTLEQVAEEDLRDRTAARIAELLSVSDAAALEAYELGLAGQALKWAADRDRIEARSVNELAMRLREGLARDADFLAVGSRLIEKMVLDPDAEPADFFEGRRARLGHVVAGLDVRRSEWLQRIDQGFSRAALVVVRAPSGQGKSTLAYRYAIENWPAHETTIVRSLQSDEDVNALIGYLRFRSRLRLPVRVLIDADYRTRFWPLAVSAIAGMGGQSLVTVRVEDWHRFSLDSLTRREIIEPFLDWEEAERIYATFRARDQVHPAVKSAAWAFEKLRKPRLLLEFVYLITQGTMLEERLRDQIRDFKQVGDDPVKVELLRIVALANALGAPVAVDELLHTVPLRDDPQEVIGSILGEYVTLEDGTIRGLHWVRSDHLARILHENGVPPPTSTALTAASVVPAAALRFLVPNALGWKGIDKELFVHGLAERFRGAPMATILAIIWGLFEAGERAFFEEQRPIFDEVHALAGPGGLLLVQGEVAPILQVSIVGKLAGTLGDRAGGLVALHELVKRFRPMPRGLEMVGDFLREVGPHRTAEDLASLRGAELGELLDWLSLTGAPLEAWKDVQDHVVDRKLRDDDTGDDLAALAQGLFRFDRGAFNAWLTSHEGDLLARLQLATRSLTLDLTRPAVALEGETGEGLGGAGEEGDPGKRRDEVESAQEDALRFGSPSADVEVVFAVETGDATPHEQSMKRLRLLRSGLPFAGRYSSRGDYFLPPGIQLPLDETVKKIRRWNLPVVSDVEKNAVWYAVVSNPYLPDTIYHLQEAWYGSRSMALRLVRAHVEFLRRILRGQPARVDDTFGADLALHTEFEAAVTRLAHFSEDAMSRIDPSVATGPLRPLLERPAPNHWVTALQNFSRQILEYFVERNEHTGRLVLHNCREAAETLDSMHLFFDVLFQETPDYFLARSLDQPEKKAYGSLLLLVEGLVDPLGWEATDPERELSARAAERSAAKLGKIQRIVADASAALGVELSPPISVAREGGLASVAIGVETASASLSGPELLVAVAAALTPIADLADRVWLLPLQGGARLGVEGYAVGTAIMRQDQESWFGDTRAAWQFLFPIPVPSEVLACLPPLDVLPAAQPTLVEKLVGLQAAADAYCRRRRSIDAITADRDQPALRRLAELERESLADLEEQLRSTTREVREGLLALEVPSGSDTRLDGWLERVRWFIDDVEALVTADVVPDAPQLPDAMEEGLD